jgi:hypothetical protein
MNEKMKNTLQWMMNYEKEKKEMDKENEKTPSADLT